MSANAVTPGRTVGIVTLAAGSVYFVSMLARFVLGAMIFAGDSWFARPLPTLFHLVLAGIVLVYGRFHFRYGSSE